jgi:DNA-binding XRE family transcriptional regulator
MPVKNSQLKDYDAVLDAQYGKEGTPERDKFRQEGLSFCTSQLIYQARKEAHITQQELANRTNTSKSYISRVENGLIEPSAGMFLRIITSLGMRFDIVKPLNP